MREPTGPGTECSGHCGCKETFDRRGFIGVVGAGAAALLSARFSAFAGPFDRSDFGATAPADKMLAREWIDSLTARGLPDVYRGEELKYIGMPIGGLCAGQLYLGGDGRLWHWDVRNQSIQTGADHYAHPIEPAFPLEQGFVIRLGSKTCPLDQSGFADIRFRGEYPIGIVEYRDPAIPVQVTLEAFSPFTPLSTDDSSFPATVMNFTVTNTGAEPLELDLIGRLENAICRDTPGVAGIRRNRVVRDQNCCVLELAAEKSDAQAEAPRPDILFEDWNRESFAPWKVEGTSFGNGPADKKAIPTYQGDVGGDGVRVVNSHASAPGPDVAAKDAAVGMLQSPEFTIERNFIEFWIGGGNHSGRTCLNLVVDNKVVRTATGQANNRMVLARFDVRELRGRVGRIDIVDAESGGWGNVGVGSIAFTDSPRAAVALEDAPDYGTMGIALVGDPPEYINAGADVSIGERLIGEMGRALKLAPKQSSTVTFIITWHFPNLKMDKLPGGRWYAERFGSAAAVALHVSSDITRLTESSRLWRDTWYDSTLPYWFLDRTFLNTSILATSTCHRFKDGRFYGWEGVGCCAGTCGHVWQYAHAVARLFPDLERATRERVDFGIAQRPDGAIVFRAEHGDIPAVDAQAGTILRAYREHQMSSNDTFLRQNWDRITLAVEWLVAKDANDDGLIESNQHNTLDTDWFGPVAWLSGLYVAALGAAEAMAEELGDTDRARRYRRIREIGSRNIVKRLFDRGYFVNRPDPKRPETINSGSGCEIDQVMGQSWAWQVGLGRVLPKRETESALRSLWRYNFTPDVGPYRQANKPGRWYAMPGEAGLLMCTFPRSDWNYDKAKGKGAEWAAGYFNECMNGFEYQAAGHMIWEGMITEGLAVARAVHDRYHASRRNPWNEVECGDHYARSMASYGVFLAACGFEYHGPRGHIGFAPRLSPEHFKAAFTGAEGWGSFEQMIDVSGHRAAVIIRWGTLEIRTIALAPSSRPTRVTVELDGRELASAWRAKDGQILISFSEDVRVQAGSTLTITMN